MATHSSTLAWKTPWMEEPGGLLSMGSRRVGHDWATSLSLFTFMPWRRKWQPTPVFLPGESQGREPGGLPSMGSHRVRHDWRDLAAAATSLGASQVALVVKKTLPANAGDIRDTSSIPELGRYHWRKEWQPTPSVLAWKILWTGEPGKLQSMGLQRVRHNWSDLARTSLILSFLIYKRVYIVFSYLATIRRKTDFWFLHGSIQCPDSQGSKKKPDSVAKWDLRMLHPWKLSIKSEGKRQLVPKNSVLLRHSLKNDLMLRFLQLDY